VKERRRIERRVGLADRRIADRRNNPLNTLLLDLMHRIKRRGKDGAVHIPSRMHEDDQPGVIIPDDSKWEHLVLPK
jgi:hypothetical protein